MFFAHVIFICLLSISGLSTVCARPAGYFLPYFAVMAANVTEASRTLASAPQASETAQLPSYITATSDDEPATVTPSAPTAVVTTLDPAQAVANAAMGLQPLTAFLTSIIIGGGSLLISVGWA